MKKHRFFSVQSFSLFFFFFLFSSCFVESYFDGNEMVDSGQDMDLLSRFDLLFQPGNKRIIYEFDLLHPLWREGENFLFLDVRGVVDNKDASEGNLGLAYRRVLGSSFLPYESVWGVYSFYDRRRSSQDNVWHQMVFGTELLFENFDLHLNYYHPTTDGSKRVPSWDGAIIKAGSIVIDHGFEKAMSGYDIELRHRIPLQIFSSDQLWISSGYYSFSEKGLPRVSGPRLKCEMEFNRIPYLFQKMSVTLGAEYKGDNVRGDNVSAYARVSIPLGKGSLGGQPLFSHSVCERLKRRIVRDVDIISVPNNTSEPATLDSTHVALDQVFIVKNNNEIHEATSFGKEKSLIIVQGDISVSHPVRLKEGQVLVSGGETLDFVSASNSNKHYLFKVPGEKGSLDNVFQIDKPTIVKKENNLVMGLTTTPIPHLFSGGILVNPSMTQGTELSDFTMDSSAGNGDLTYSIVGSDSVLEGFFTFDANTGILTRTSKAIGSDVSFLEVNITAQNSENESTTTTGAILLASQTIPSDRPFVKSRSYEGHVLIKGTSGVTDANMDHALTVLTDLLEKDKQTENRPLLTGIIKNGACMEIYADENERDGDLSKISSGGRAQDLQNDEMFPGVSKDSNASDRDASVEEILHLIHDYGIDYMYPEFQKKLEESLNVAVSNNLYVPQPDVAGTPSDVNEYLAMALQSYYGFFAGTHGATLNQGEYTPLTRDAVKTQDRTVYDLIETLFPENLNHLE